MKPSTTEQGVCMPQLSIIIPTFNNSKYLLECVHSVTTQEFKDIEVIIVDDASTDNTPTIAAELTTEDSRVHFIRHSRNSGTLASRKTGVLTSTGRYVMLMDQDDELASGALRKLLDFANGYPADIYHFGVQVIAANASAQQAAAGMTTFLTPIPRRLNGETILLTQFSPNGNFDWHVHHKMYRGDLARSAYALAANQRLVLSDDLYVSFILDSIASTYISIPNSPWYLYHLGRGDTLGHKLTPGSLSVMAQWDAQALSMLTTFISRNHTKILRSDWSDRLADVRDKLIEHTMNEWKDNLPDNDKTRGLQRILDIWAPDTVCGELYRYVRDYAYAYLVAGNRQSEASRSDQKQAEWYLRKVQHIERLHGLPSKSDNRHYLSLRKTAYNHLYDSGILQQPQQETTKSRDNRLEVMLKRLFAGH